MSFRESVIIPYALFKKCQFGALPPPAPEPAPPLPPEREPTPEPDEPEVARDIDTPPPPPPPPYVDDEQKLKLPKKEEKETVIAKMSRAVPEEDRPIVERILEHVQAHPRLLRWDENFQVIINDVLYPKSNILEILKFIMKKQVVENNRGTPFGAKDFVDNLINVIKIPKDWIKTSFIRTSKRKQRGISPEGDDEETDETKSIVPHSKRARSQTGRGISPWISY